MGCSISHLDLGTVVDTTVHSINIENPKIETIDYEGYYSTLGQLKIHLSNKDGGLFTIIGYFGEKYKSTGEMTDVIKTMDNMMVPLTVLNGKRIINLENVISKKMMCLTYYHYEISLDNMEKYKVFVDRFS